MSKKDLDGRRADAPGNGAVPGTLAGTPHRLDPQHLIFIDESSIKTSMTRTCSWAKKGKRLTAQVPHGHWKTLKLLADLRHDGIVAAFVLDGPINGDTFTNLGSANALPLSAHP